jgi:hypothetical protein
VAAARANELPAILLQELDDFANLHAPEVSILGTRIHQR